PFRKDKHPSFCIYYTSNGNIRYKDFSTGENGSVIEFVMVLFNISLSEAESLIAKDFNLSKKTPIIKDIRSFNNYGELSQESKSEIYYKTRLFTNTDRKYWESYHISLQTLRRFDVRSCQDVVVIKKNNCISYRYTSNDPIYLYLIDKGAFKIYRPLSSKKNKWLSHCSWKDIQGLRQLPNKINRCIITKSLKDVMVLYELGYNSVAPQSEGSWMLDKQYDYICSISDESPIIFYDNDKAGMQGSLKFSKEYNIERIYIPEEYLQYNIKDISDFIKKYGKEEAKTLLEKLIN